MFDFNFLVFKSKIYIAMVIIVMVIAWKPAPKHASTVTDFLNLNNLLIGLITIFGMVWLHFDALLLSPYQPIFKFYQIICIPLYQVLPFVSSLYADYLIEELKDCLLSSTEQCAIRKKLWLICRFTRVFHVTLFYGCGIFFLLSKCSHIMNKT